MQRVYNFSAGPAMLPETVLQTAKAQMLDWDGSGMSVMEISHRSPAFEALLADTKQRLRDLMCIPDNYQILFMASGARGQFAAVPLNLLAANEVTNYAVTGIWSQLAAKEAEKYATVNHVFENKEINITAIPEQKDWSIDTNSGYLYYTPNETLLGLEFPYVPSSSLPLVADMTSCILSRYYDVSQFGLIYASAQKNLGQAGVTLVIVRDDLIKSPQAITPEVFSYQSFAKTESLYNTPPTYAIYIMNLVLKEIQNIGGVKTVEALNRQKSDRLYAYIDDSDFYVNKISPACRSRVNVSFNCPTEQFDAQFSAYAATQQLVNLKGHSSVGGLRASLYNAMPMIGVEKLIECMQQFAKDHQ